MNIKDFKFSKKDISSEVSYSDDLWKDKIYKMKDKGIEDKPNKNNSLVNPLEVMHALSSCIRGRKTVVVTGVGCHQHWACKTFAF